MPIVKAKNISPLSGVWSADFNPAEYAISPLCDIDWVWILMSWFIVETRTRPLLYSYSLYSTVLVLVLYSTVYTHIVHSCCWLLLSLRTPQCTLIMRSLSHAFESRAYRLYKRATASTSTCCFPLCFALLHSQVQTFSSPYPFDFRLIRRSSH